MHDDPIALLNAALTEVVERGGSDLHIAAGRAPAVRVSGELRPIQGVGEWDADAVETILSAAMTEKQRRAFAEDLELDFAYTLSADSRFRVNVYRQRDAWGAAFRLIPTEIKSLGQLGLPASIGEFADLPRGLVLVTGPTGSGKSTTLAALIDRANETRADHIMTIEDPIEFVHSSKRALVNQREVGADTQSFGAALKHVLRQDPDIILLGELRDLESISVALTAAETGHLVFATLHTSDASQSIDRIIDVFPAHQQQQVRMQLSLVLQGVVCQTLVPKASGQGRAVAVEVLKITPAVSNLIRAAKTSQIVSAMQTGSNLGMQTMDQHLAALASDGTITQEAAEGKAHDVETVRQLITKPRFAGASNDFFSMSSMGGR
ncbi:type IV pilus twitching motility protein PilT [Amnibacterium endophyticum]|uniref:Type IV pilus twitching motility protein PilT n=1 Tax=Amnibacterium endophyticum TaxID=2109337 RepID=A0ABW4LEI9_9MICO